MASKTVTLKERVRAMILESLPPGANGGSAIFGQGGMLDSLGLVSFLADLEYRLSEEFDRDVLLASEQTMSRSRSPFRDVSTLTDFVIELVEE
jgi:hypothetical protein